LAEVVVGLGLLTVGLVVMVQALMLVAITINKGAIAFILDPLELDLKHDTSKGARVNMAKL
jgi:hypothetical protein